MANGINNAVSREAVWFLTDPCPTFVTAPPQLLHRLRTVTDGQVFASSNVASSLTANFTSADVGSTIGSSTSFASSATIVVVTNASSVIMSASSTASASSTGNTFYIDNGAPFDVVQGHFSKSQVRSRNMYISLANGGEIHDELATIQEREAVYPMLITVQWSFEQGQGSLETEQQNLENAVNSILLRLRGPAGNKTHNGQFTAVAAGGPEGDGRISVRMLNSYDQVINREPLGAEIRYFATDWLSADTA